MVNSKPKILIVDDDETCCIIAEEVAQNICDYKVAKNGEDAVSAFIDTFKNQKRKFDAILLDFEMPIMNGVQASAEVLKIQPDLKIIALTTFEDDENLQQTCKYSLFRP